MYKVFKITKGNLMAVLLGLIAIAVPCIWTANYLTVKTNTGVMLSDKVIVVDPGHGGIDGGTTYKEELLEKDINLNISLALKAALEQSGATVIMTRDSDVSLDDQQKNSGSRHREDLNARIKLITDNNPDIFLSIHTNSNDSDSAMGPFVFYSSSNEKAKVLAQHVQQTLNELSQYKPKKDLSTRLAGAGNYFLLNNTKIPGIIIETGFITSSFDRALLTNSTYIQEFVNLIVKSLGVYFSN